MDDQRHGELRRPVAQEFCGPVSQGHRPNSDGIPHTVAHAAGLRSPTHDRCISRLSRAGRGLPVRKRVGGSLQKDHGPYAPPTSRPGRQTFLVGAVRQSSSLGPCKINEESRHAIYGVANGRHVLTCCPPDSRRSNGRRSYHTLRAAPRSWAGCPWVATRATRLTLTRGGKADRR